MHSYSCVTQAAAAEGAVARRELAGLAAEGITSRDALLSLQRAASQREAQNRELQQQARRAA